MTTTSSDEIFAGSLTGAAATAWHLGRLVKAHYPGKAILDGIGSPFDLEDFARAKKCEATLATDGHGSMATGWTRAGGLATGALNATYDVRWEGQLLHVIVGQWKEGFDRHSQSIVVADSLDVARAFTSAVCEFCNHLGNTILRFTAGCWSRSHELWTGIQEASFDDLVLAGDLKNQIITDFSLFLGAKAEYARYRIPHKRGVLLLGPPGNGKTHCLRALIKYLGVPCLYVQSFKSRYGEEDSSIEQVFRRAREITPCCLVFEDLDAMINDGNRSFFLNQLDGLGDASGLLTIATTNHAEKLDSAILERPSRFDRKYHFALPGPAERTLYLQKWNDRLDPEMRIDERALATVVELTDDFSFAYLKELYLSSMTRWIADRMAGGMVGVLTTQVALLRAQMKSPADP